MKDFGIFVPSLGRPHSIERLRDTMASTCRGDTHLIVGLNEEDPRRGEYPPGIEYVVRPGIRGVVAWLNELAVPRAGDFRFIGALGDDHVPKTVGWDLRMAGALGKTPFAFGNDLYPRTPGELPTHIFTRSEVVRALGYLGVPRFRHMYVDAGWKRWGEAIGITYLDDVIIEHLHYTVGKSPVDATYAASAPLMGPDEVAYRAYCADPDGLEADIGRIKAVLLWAHPPMTC